MEANTLGNALRANGLQEILHQSLESGQCPSPIAGMGDTCGLFCASCIAGAYVQ
jgi:hypothetical protein